LELEKFAEKTANMVKVISLVPVIPEIKASYSSLIYKEHRAIANAFFTEDVAEMVAKKTIRVVIMEDVGTVYEYEIPENATLKIEREWSPMFQFYMYTTKIEDFGVHRLIISSIVEYLEPKNKTGKTIIEKLSGTECKTCYVETVEPFIVYEKDVKKTYPYFDVERKIEEKIGDMKNNLTIEEYMVYKVIKTGEKRDYFYDELYIDSTVVSTRSLIDKVMDRFSEMHDTLVRGVVRIVERFI